MNDHSCDAIIITCIDFRFQPYINQWINENFEPKTYDRVAWAGGVKDRKGILKQIELSQRLHHIKKVALINHEDCGVYGTEGTSKKHIQDLKSTKGKILSQFPSLEVNLYYLHPDNTFEEIV